MNHRSYYRNLKRYCGVWLLSLLSVVAYGQGNLSPYSILGLGEFAPQGNLRSVGMGGVGMALPSLAYSNTQNAALLPINSYTMLDLSFLGSYYQYNSSETSTDGMSGNLLGVSLTFPVVRGYYSMAVGIRPMTHVNYDLFSEEKLSGTSAFVQYDYEGSGGVSQAYWSHGLRLAKGLFLGAEFSYNFGAIQNESRATVLDSRSQFSTNLLEETNFSDLNFTPSIAYNIEVDSAVYIGIGAKYETGLDLSVDYNRQYLRQSLSGAILTADTLRKTNGVITVPARISGGISFYSPFHYSIGIDASYAAWSEYSNDVRSTNLADSYRVAIGGEWTPDINSVSSYWKRVTYRMGGHYENTPWVVNNTQISDVGLSVGLSMPVSRGLSNLNWAFSFGQRGTTDNELIQERYFKVGLGISINDPQWFRRRRIN